MKKKVIVLKKCKSHRIGATLLLILMFAGLTACVISLRNIAGLLLFLPSLVIFVPYLLYFLTWSLRFEEKYIVKSVFGKAVRSYPYTALLEVSKRYYISERNYIVRMYFLDGKTLHFRTDADHADKAMKVLKRHCSITAPSR